MRDQPQPGDSRKSLGVWLSLLVLMICAAVAIRIDASRDHVLPLQMKAGRPVAKPTTRSSEQGVSPLANAVRPVVASPAPTVESATAGSASPLIRKQARLFSPAWANSTWKSSWIG